MSTTTRRAALRGASLVGLLGVPAVAFAARSSTANPDAELVRTCHRFAEGELARRHRYIVATEDLADEQDTPFDRDTYDWIAATPATTPEGWHAKALAYSAWATEAYDDHEDSRDSTTTFLAALLRDMVAPARNAIVARCTAKYGPLPTQYTAEGIWIGYSAEEKAAINAKHEVRVAAREAEQAAEMDELVRATTVETMNRKELERSATGFLEMRDLADSLHKKVLERLAGDVA
jgi:hypothetical protein